MTESGRCYWTPPWLSSDYAIAPVINPLRDLKEYTSGSLTIPVARCSQRIRFERLSVENFTVKFYSFGNEVYGIFLLNVLEPYFTDYREVSPCWHMELLRFSPLLKKRASSLFSCMQTFTVLCPEEFPGSFLH